MTITDVKIRRNFTEGRLKAIVSVTIDQLLAIHEIKVIQGPERLFIAMPSKKDGTVFRDIVHPISPEFRSILETTILQEYQKHMNGDSSESSSSGKTA